VISRLHLDRGRGLQENVHARAEFHHPDALAAAYSIPNLLRENNAAR
jgi:hypothetical protein